ncbi:MAG: glycosyltransferase family 2 protein [Proteobacteria bacterium]|nr:glycosyltransferase family 2 protein [Pseudomonadota bacterium]
MQKIPVSCFVIAQNEADRIVRTIRSVRPWVDEVIVVDSGSTDATIKVALAEGCRVMAQEWLGFGGQKRFAEAQCRNDWVLNVDADEVVTPELAREIIALFKAGEPQFVAYGMPIQMVYPGAIKPRPFARDHWYVRLYDRRVVRFRDSSVHDSVVTGGHAVGCLKAPMHHFSMRSFSHMKQKLDERTWLLARNAGRSLNAAFRLRLVSELPMNFFKYYFVRRHCMGGMMGLKYTLIQSRYRLLKIYRICSRASGTAEQGPGLAPGT